jgi:hypothetical protein
MRHKLSFYLFLDGASALRLGAGLGSLLAVSACGPKFGDGCKNSTDCSVTNARICDRAQPGGYCTIANCKPGDCGDDGICVRFNANEPRLSVSYCMGKCDNTKDCDRDEYVCRNANQLNRGTIEDAVEDDAPILGEAFVEVLEGSGKAKFCVVKE